MKKRVLVVFISLFVLCFGVCFSGCGGGTLDEGQLMRLHIRANSNGADDQAVKLKVRDRVVDFLEAELSEITSLSVAKSEITRLKGSIKALADEVLKDNGFSYRSKVRVNNEFFPTRMYDNLVVESGYYDALIIELGSGTGDNWWCVVYPPLCYVEANYGSGFKYKSKIKEIWDKYFG